jgi:DNA-binding transcriptional activator of the SARP family
MALYRLRLLGAFQLVAPNGQRLDVTSKKAIALLGLLASANSGERWRAWIQDKLWGSRELRQAQASLRRELHGLRKLTAGSPLPLVEATSRTVRLNLNVVDVDIRSEDALLRSSGEFLEGIDIAGEESFEEWLREMRNNLADLSGPMPLAGKQYHSSVGLD